MEDRETPRMHKYGESKTTRIMMETVRHVTSSSGLRKISGRWIFFRLNVPEKKMVVDRWKEYFQGKLSNQDQTNTEFDLEEVDFNVTNQEITEPIYLEVRNIILNLNTKKHQG